MRRSVVVMSHSVVVMCLSVCLSVCLVCWYRVRTTELTLRQSTMVFTGFLTAKVLMKFQWLWLTSMLITISS